MFNLRGNSAVQTSVLYHKPITIVNDDSRVMDKLETSLTYDDRVVIYNCHMFIVQTTEEEDNEGLYCQPWP